jgi:hypothetical protein
VQQLAAPAQHGLPGKQHAAPAWQQSWLLVQHVLSVQQSASAQVPVGQQVRSPDAQHSAPGTQQVPSVDFEDACECIPQPTTPRTAAAKVVMIERRFMINSSSGKHCSRRLLN